MLTRYPIKLIISHVIDFSDFHLFDLERYSLIVSKEQGVGASWSIFGEKII